MMENFHISCESSLRIAGRLVYFSIFATLFLLSQASNITTRVIAQQDDHLIFVIDTELMLAHLGQAAENLDGDDVGLAAIHSKLAAGLYFGSISKEVLKKDPVLEEQLRAELETITNSTGNLQTSDFGSKLQLMKLLVRKAVPIVVGQEMNDLSFQGRVISALLNSTATTYDKAVENGEVVDELAYQTAIGLFDRVQLAKSGATTLPESQRIEILLDDLSIKLETQGEADDVSTLVLEFNKEFREQVRLALLDEQEEGPQADDFEPGKDFLAWERIERINLSLDEIIAEYQAGNIETALDKTNTVYNEDYLMIKNDIAKNDTDLADKIDEEIRMKLVEMIKTGRPSSEISTLVEEIKMDTERAKTVVVPELPLTQILAALTISTLLVTMKIHSRKR